MAERGQHDMRTNNTSKSYPRSSEGKQYTQNFETRHVIDEYAKDIIKCLIASDVRP